MGNLSLKNTWNNIREYFTSHHVNQKKWFRCMTAFLLCLSCILCVYAFFHVTPFGEKSLLVDDMYAEYYAFMNYFQTHILKGNGSLLYSWNIALGDEFFSDYAFLIASPLLLLFASVFPISHLAILTLYSGVKVALCGLSMMIFLECSGRKRSRWNYCFALCYSLMGIFFAGNQNLMFLDGYFFLPLEILFVEQCIEKKKIFGLIFCSAGAMLGNFYTGYMVLLFALLYSLYYCIGNKISWKRCWFRILLCIGMGCLLDAWILFPSFFSILAARGGDTSLTMEFFRPNQVVELVSGFFGQYFTNDNSSSTSIYCGILPLLLLPLYFWTSSISKREKICSLAMLGVFLVSFLFGPLNQLWHLGTVPKGFPNRFAFLLVFMVLILGKQAVDNTKKISFVQILVCGGIPLGMLLLSWQTKIAGFTESLVLINTVFIVAYAVLLFFRYHGSYTRLFGVGILCLVSVELACNGVAMMQAAEEHAYAYELVEDYVQSDNDVKALLSQVQDTGFYRMDDEAPRSLDDGMMYGYHGISSYSSSFDEETYRFLKQIGFSRKQNKVSFSGNTELTNDLLGIRYVLSQTPSYMGYTPIAAEGSKYLMKNEYSLPLAYVIDSRVATPFTSQPLENISSFSSFVLGTDTIVQDIEDPGIEYVNCYYYEEEDGTGRYFPLNPEEEWYLQLTVTLPTAQSLYIQVDNSWDAISQCWVDDQWRGTITGKDTTLLYLGDIAAQTPITIQFKPVIEYLSYDAYRLFTFDEDAIHQGVDTIQQTGIPSSLIVRDTSVSITCQASENQILFTTIPTNPGWSATVNGKQVSVESYQDTFITIPLEPGENIVEFTFSIYGRNVGIFLTIVSLSGIILVLFLRRKYVSSKKHASLQKERSA